MFLTMKSDDVLFSRSLGLPNLHLKVKSALQFSSLYAHKWRKHQITLETVAGFHPHLLSYICSSDSG